MYLKTTFFIFLFTTAIVAPFCIQLCDINSEISSIITTDEEGKTDTFEIESEKITEEISSYKLVLKFQKIDLNPIFTNKNSSWNTIYREPNAPPPKHFL